MACTCTFLLLFLLIITSSMKFTITNSCPALERSALLQFNNNFIINCKVSDPRYACPTTSSWPKSVEDCCQWHGVKCSRETGHVISLDLSSSCLFGSFPSNTSLFSLPYLNHLDLSGNNFNHSPIPLGFGHNLSNLKSLNLNDSGFRGEVPRDISQLSGLSLLDLSANAGLQLKDLGRFVQNFTRLQHLSLDSVDLFSNSVPKYLANLTSLRTFSLRFCNLHGHFPISMFNLPHLEKIDINGNLDVSGVLPDEFEHFSPLTVINLSYTSFSGEISPSIAALAHLEMLSLKHCTFFGHVPSSIGNLTNLIALELSGNHFSGDMPSSFTNLTQLRYLSISDLTVRPQQLYPWLSKLTKLPSLGIYSMNLTGEIPTVIANFTGLKTLTLDGNHLTGQIPHWLMNLTDLTKLSLKNNQLEGSLPPMFSQLESLKFLVLNGNYNLRVNISTLLKLKHLKSLKLDGLKLTLPATNASDAKLNVLTLNLCNLTEFPAFLHSQKDLQLLELQNNQIQGVVPLWFINVTRENLLLLDLSRNFLTGFEHTAKVLPWVNLEILNLNKNKIHGSLPIPSKSLLMYQVLRNSFSGDIPQGICRASCLKYIDLSFNQLGGNIPECIGHLGSNLQILNLQGNIFDGSIPSIYPKTCNLKIINLSNNQLRGNIPKNLGNCKMLEVLDIGSNGMNDTFPLWLRSLPKLQILVLRRNNFHGRIGTPNDSFGFRSLRIMDLSHNFHTGSLPSEYFENCYAMKDTNEAESAYVGISVTIMLMTFSLQYSIPRIVYNYKITIVNKGNDMFYSKVSTVFRVIDFSSNNFSSRIPDSIGELKGLQAINLSNNNLEGGIPSLLANIRDLQSLDLSNNKLSGGIPQQLAQITFLEIFNVSHNFLDGPIPLGFQFGTFDNSSFEGNKGLCGGTLTKKCGNQDKPPPSVSVPIGDDEDESSNVIDWVIRSLGCVSGFVIGCVAGKYITDKKHVWFKETFGSKNRRTRTTRRQRS